MMADYDVVVVGAGIGGSALASVLARGGRRVLVLEQQTAYRDKVRGETIVPWGVLELKRMGLESTVLDAGGQYATQFVPYDEMTPPAEAEAGAIPIALLCPGAEGQLNVGHPEASEALSRKAESDGAVVVRGVQDVKVAFGTTPSVRYADGTESIEVTAGIVVGADGRASTVRKQAGLVLEERPARTYGAGLLVRGEAGFTERNTLGSEGDAHFLAFPRSGDLTRLYLLVDIARQSEFTGASRLQRFREVFGAITAFPAAAALAQGEPAGPAGGAPMTDSWTTEAPVTAGAVLVGDAAGWNDPIIGQGLSIALRDARSVGDALLAVDHPGAADFADYVTERRERMRRLAVAARVATEMRCTFTDDARERRGRWLRAFMTDPTMLAQTLATIAGPEAFPAEAYTDEAVATTFAV